MSRALLASLVIHMVMAGVLMRSLQPAEPKPDTSVALDEVTIRERGAERAQTQPRQEPQLRPKTEAPAQSSVAALNLPTQESLTVSRNGTETNVTIADYEHWARGHNRAPAYPRASNQAREQGRVVIRISVRTDGVVASAEIESSSGHERLDQAALEAVRDWTFPKYKNAKSSLLLRLPFKFELYD